MKITKSNFESWHLDYLEGNLDQMDRAHVEAFLNQNPVLANHLGLEDIIPLSDPEKIIFEAKELLKKTKLEDNSVFEAYLIAYKEQDLSPEETVKFEGWLLEHPEKEKFKEHLCNYLQKLMVLDH